MLRPDEIVGHRFNKKLRGYDPAEVDRYLETLADEFVRLEERAHKLETLANEYERARKSYDKIIKEAQERAAQIIMDAESIGSNLVNNAQHRKQQIEAEITKLEHTRERHVQLVEQLIKTGQKLLDALHTTEDFEDEQGEEMVE